MDFNKYKNKLKQPDFKVFCTESNDAEWEAYHNERLKNHKSFKNDLFEEFRVCNNPKRHKCFSLAWDIGHSNGLREVANWFSELVELIKEMPLVPEKDNGIDIELDLEEVKEGTLGNPPVGPSTRILKEGKDRTSRR